MVYLLIWRKAFDTVIHAILLTKLHCYEIRCNVNEWFISHLPHREQFVIASRHDSKSLLLACGVSHGFILGPLQILFLL